MALLPEGFALPSLPYLLVLVVAVLAVGVALYRRSPPVTERTALAISPWMVAGSALYVLFQIDAVPASISPFLGSPAVYLTTFVVLGVVWLGTTLADGRASADSNDQPGTNPPPASAVGAPRTAAVVGTIGVVLALAVGSLALWIGLRRGTLRAFWPAVGLVVAAALTSMTWAVAARTHASTAGWAGVLVVFAHTLDGVSTAVGIDVLGFGEQTPLAQVFIDIAASLPVSDLLGTVWLFVAVKIALATFIIWLLADAVEERPREGYLLCTFVAAVGLGPGSHNLLLFTVLG